MLKKLFVVIFLLLVAAEVWALPISAGDKVTMLNDWYVPYSMMTSDGTVYSSFCLENEQYFTPGTTYTVSSIGDYAIGGGKGAVDGMDLVSDDTKKLYAAFMSGVLSDYSAKTVQDAIWYLEDEIASDSAWNTLKSLNAFIIFDATGWDVAAVNITLNGVDNQSQLIGAKITAPVPEPATMILLGSGLIGLAGVRRKSRKSH